MLFCWWSPRNTGLVRVWIMCVFVLFTFTHSQICHSISYRLGTCCRSGAGAPCKMVQRRSRSSSSPPRCHVWKLSWHMGWQSHKCSPGLKLALKKPNSGSTLFGRGNTRPYELADQMRSKPTHPSLLQAHPDNFAHPFHGYGYPVPLLSPSLSTYPKRHVLFCTRWNWYLSLCASRQVRQIRIEHPPSSG